MALSATAAEVNASIIETMVLMEAYIETLTTGTRAEEIMICFGKPSKGDDATEGWGDDQTAKLAATSAGGIFDVKGRVYRIPVKADTSGTSAPIPLKAGSLPMWWLITNDAGDLA